MGAIARWIEAFFTRSQIKNQVIRIGLSGTREEKYGGCFRVTYQISPACMIIFLSPQLLERLDRNLFRDIRKKIVGFIAMNIVKRVQTGNAIGATISLSVDDFDLGDSGRMLVDLKTGEQIVIVRITKIVYKT